MCPVELRSPIDLASWRATEPERLAQSLNLPCDESFKRALALFRATLLSTASADMYLEVLFQRVYMGQLQHLRDLNQVTPVDSN